LIGAYATKIDAITNQGGVMRQLSLGKKIFLGYSLILILAVVLGVIGVIRISTFGGELSIGLAANQLVSP
jgi:hypothetical protein